jgi:hypothetical protein
MSNLDILKIEEQIKKTGFVLEHKLASLFKKAGWHVISNRYYIDDHEENIREIDLLAYKISKVQDISVYTTLIVSCKKSESNNWALLTKDIDLKAPNSEWWPLHAWTNEKSIQYKLNLKGNAKKYHEDLNILGVKHVLEFPQREVFAFQEMDKKTGTPQNDKPIFSSITSLMKAQAYEVNSLPTRKKDAAVYQFNLLTIVDTDLARVHFKDDSIKAQSTESEHYIARYIIRKKETVSRIRFINADKFESYLEDYDKLHKANCSWFSASIDDFYKDIVKNGDRVSILVDEFRKKLSWYFGYIGSENKSRIIDFSDLSIEWRSDENKVAVVSNSMTAEVIARFNQSKHVVDITSKALKNIYRYDGKFIFSTSEDIPF